MQRIGRDSRDLPCQQQALSSRSARSAFMGMTPMHHGGGAIEIGLEVALVGVVADRFRHDAFVVGDHAVGGDDDIALDAAQSGGGGLEDGEIAQQRKNADNDDDNAHDLFGAAVDRQHIDKIKDQNDDKKGDQDTDEDGHANPRFETFGLISLFTEIHNDF
jgi:hypothetical protein